MRVLFGVLALLIALTVVFTLVQRQLEANTLADASPAQPAPRDLPKAVADDVQRALQQGAAARREAP